MDNFEHSFICLICNRKFDSPKALHYHIETNRKSEFIKKEYNRIVKCDLHGLSFEEARSLVFDILKRCKKGIRIIHGGEYLRDANNRISYKKGIVNKLKRYFRSKEFLDEINKLGFKRTSKYGFDYSTFIRYKFYLGQTGSNTLIESRGFRYLTYGIIIVLSFLIAQTTYDIVADTYQIYYFLIFYLIIFMFFTLSFGRFWGVFRNERTKDFVKKKYFYFHWFSHLSLLFSSIQLIWLGFSYDIYLIISNSIGLFFIFIIFALITYMIFGYD